jgi:hypothetical protein
LPGVQNSVSGSLPLSGKNVQLRGEIHILYLGVTILVISRWGGLDAVKVRETLNSGKIIIGKKIPLL